MGSELWIKGLTQLAGGWGTGMEEVMFMNIGGDIGMAKTFLEVTKGEP